MMKSHSPLIIPNNNLVIWNTINPFLSGLAGVGLGLLIGFYLGLI